MYKNKLINSNNLKENYSKFFQTRWTWEESPQSCHVLMLP